MHTTKLCKYGRYDIIITQIPLIPTNSALPFKFRWLQFSISLYFCFSLTVKAVISCTISSEDFIILLLLTVSPTAKLKFN